MSNVHILNGDCRDVLRSMPDQSVHCCVTSPPYFGLRDYGHAGQIGLEQTPEAFVAELVDVFREVHRVLRDDGTLWLNLGDSYASGAKGSGGTGKSTLGAASGGNKISVDGIARSQARQAMAVRKLDCGLPDKNLLGIPWRVAFALQADGWYLRQEIIWHKPNPMPESVRDRFTKAHEQVFLLSKSPRYYFDQEAVKEPALQPRGEPSRVAQHKQTAIGQNKGGTLGTNYGPETRNRRSVWTVSTKPYAGAHFATFPPDLIEPCILAGCPVGGTVLDPFGGAGTTGLAAVRHQRNAVLIELNPTYADMARDRIADKAGIFATVKEKAPA